MSEASSLPLSPGSNLICNRANPENGRIRREWDHMDDYDRALYLDAVETAIERGLHQRFAEFHSDEGKWQYLYYIFFHPDILDIIHFFPLKLFHHNNL